MMKKTLFLLSALLLAGIGAKAQTAVVHGCEAEFEDWTITGNSSGLFQKNTWSTEADASGMVTPFIEYWVGSGGILPDAIISHTALTDLETGYYEVSIFARAFNENSTYAVSKGITFTANDQSVDLTEGTAGDFVKGTTTSEEDYGVYELLVYVSDGTLNIGFTVSNVTACDWMAFKNLEVTYLGTSPVGYVAHECEAYGDDWGKPAHWTADNDKTTNLHVNKHSTEADPSGMVTPFVEYWYASGTNLPDDVLRHDQLTGLYPGNYEVSIDVRAFNESGTTAIKSGATTFNANDASVDITNAGLNVSIEFSGHYELYGTLNLIATVTAAQGSDTGTLDIDFTVSGANYNWLAFKNLKVVYDGDDMPTLTYVTGEMNSTVETAMKAAVDAYNTSKTSDNYTAALAAIAAAEESVAQYAEIAALVAALDQDGATAWESTTSGIAYINKSLTTSDDITDDMTAAQKAQTTEGTDWSYVLKNTGTWMRDSECNVSNFQVCPAFPTAHEAWRNTDFTASETHPRKPIYKMIEDLPAGTYTISFYTYAAQGTTSLTNDILAFANGASTTVDFDDLGYGPQWSGDNGLCTLICNVNVEGVLRFGMESTGKGAWYVMEEGSLKLVSLATEEATDTDSDYQKGDNVTVDGTTYTIQSENMVENHSFELGFTGWTSSNDYTSEITSTYFELRSGSASDAQDGNVYLVGATNNGVSSVGSLGTAWSIETGKTYYFSYYVKGLTSTTDGEFLKTSWIDTRGTETKSLETPTVTSEWQKVEYVFYNESYSYVQIDFRWLDNQWAFDNFQLYEIEEATGIEWTLGAKYGTLILPFAADVPDGLTAYTGTINSDGNEMVLTAVNGNAITAYTPYIIGGTEEAQTTYYFSGTPGTETGTTFTDDTSGLTGVLVDTYAPKDSYVLQKQDEEPAFYLVENAETILVAAYHCYLSGDAVSANAKAVRLVFDDDVATAIEAVEATEETGSETIYDLSGRRVAKAQKGVYIVNGKKMVIK